MNEIDMLIESAKHRKLSVFAGAAISYDAPTYAPSWFDFKKEIVAALGEMLNLPESVINMVAATNVTPEIVLEGVDRFGGMSRVYNFVQTLGQGKPNFCHRALAELFVLGYVKNIVTANWDTFLETAVPDQDTLHVVNTEDDLEDTQEVEKNLLHLHGSINDPRFIQGGFYRLGFELPPKIKTCLLRILGASDCVVLGYSGRDWDLYSAFEESLEQHDNKLFWIYLERYGLAENVERLQKKFPKKVIPIAGDMKDILGRLCGELNVQLGEIPSSPKPNREDHIKEAARELGKYYSYLTVALVFAGMGDWLRAYTLCEDATDIAYSPSLHPDGPLHHEAAEAYRLASACAACGGNIDYAEFLLRSYQTEHSQVLGTMSTAWKFQLALGFHQGLLALIKGDFEEAVRILWKTLIIAKTEKDSKILGLGADSFPMLNSAIVLLYGIARAVSEESIEEALEINIYAYASQIELRNIWGHCCSLLSLSLCYFRKKMIQDARMALQDCLEFSNQVGLTVCASAAQANLEIIEGNNVTSESHTSPIIDKKTGWHLIPDPFAFFFFPSPKED